MDDDGSGCSDMDNRSRYISMENGVVSIGDSYNTSYHRKDLYGYIDNVHGDLSREREEE